MIRGLGAPKRELVESEQTYQLSLEARLKRCDLELDKVVKLNEVVDVKELDYRSVRSVFLDKDPCFKDLIDQLRQWNDEVRASRIAKQPIHRGGFRQCLIRNLLSNLLQVSNTKDRQVQMFSLLLLRNWYTQKLASFASPPTPNTRRHNRNQSMPSQSYSTEETATGSSQAFNSGIFSSNDLNDFANNRRSKHSQIEPPDERIKSYVKKELMIAGQSVSISMGATRPGSSGLMSPSRPISQSSILRPLKESSSMRQISSLDFGSPLKHQGSGQWDINSANNLRSPGPTNNNNSSPWNYATASFFPNGTQRSSVGLQSMKFSDEAGSEASASVNVPSSISPIRKAYTGSGSVDYAESIRKNADIKSSYVDYNPSNELGEIRLENLWLTNRNKAVKEGKEKDELVNHMESWSTSRGLLDQEVNRKNELLTSGSNFKDLGKKAKTSRRYGKEVSTMKSLMEETPTAEIHENDDAGMMSKYLSLIKKPLHLKELIGQHIPACEETPFEIASRVDQQLRSPRSGIGKTRQHGFTEELIFQSMTARSLGKKESIEQEENGENAADQPERLKIQHHNLRAESRQTARDAMDSQRTLIDVEANIKQHRITHLRQSKGRIIGLTQSVQFEEGVDEEEILRRKQLSLMLHHREDNIADRENKFKPFSSIYKRLSVENLRTETMQEIQIIRQTFAKKGIKCSLNTISQSLSRPAGLPAAELILPSPGQMLFSNPFAEFTRRIRKKGKKSKK